MAKYLTTFILTLVSVFHFARATNYFTTANGDSDDPTVWTPSLPNPNIGVGDTLFVSHDIELKDNFNISGALVINGNGYFFGGKTITVNASGYLLNNGEIDVTKKVENSGKFINNGTFYTKKEFINSSTGSLENSGSFTAKDEIENSGTINNSNSLITEDSFFNLTGSTLTNTGNITVEKDFENYSSVTNSGTINIEGELINETDAIIQSNGNINVDDDITNEGTIQSSGNISTDGDFDNVSLLQNSGSVTVTDEYHNDGQTLNSGSINADNVHDDGYTCNSGSISVDQGQEYNCHSCTISCGGTIIACTVEVKDGSNISNQNFCCTDGTDTNFDFETSYVFDSTTISVCGVPLPIELLSFTGEVISHGITKINWITATESNNDFFLIERSTDGINWEAIHQTPGAGYSENIIQYSFTDNSAPFGLAFYRLKQVDFDGNFEYFNPISVEHKYEGNTLQIYPNPSENVLHILGENILKIDINIYSLEGKNLTSLFSIVNSNNNHLQLNISKLPQGIYMLTYRGERHKLIVH